MRVFSERLSTSGLTPERTPTYPTKEPALKTVEPERVKLNCTERLRSNVVAARRPLRAESGGYCKMIAFEASVQVEVPHVEVETTRVLSYNTRA